VVYNWGANSTYGGEKEQPKKPQFNFSNINMIANYYKPGPATEPGAVSHCIADPWTRNGATDYGKWYIADNVVDGNTWVSANNWLGGVQPKDGSEFMAGFKMDQPWPAMPINQQTAEEAYTSVLDDAGATLPKRDPIDVRIVDEVRNSNATFEGVSYEQKWTVADTTKKCGIIDNQTDVGGWPELRSEPAPLDSDHDGIPDYWEDENKLDKDNPNDRNEIASDGYTMLEKYLNNIG
jgi:pectate lyase